MQKIVSHLWFDTEALEAAKFYTSLFDNSKIDSVVQINDTPSGTSESVSLTIDGEEFMFISAGPIFQLTPAISLMVLCSSEEEVNHLWNELSIDGETLMELGEYPFSQRYGWLNDRYGVSWQLILTDQPVTQKIIPALLFSGERAGKAEEAINFYTTLFEDSKVAEISYYDDSKNSLQRKMVQYGEFILAGKKLAAMDSEITHDFMFTESFSILVNCENQEEIDYLWKKLSYVPEAEQCGWLKDKFGVSWQITPRVMEKMLGTEDEQQKQRVTEAFLKMKKMDISELERAFEGK